MNTVNLTSSNKICLPYLAPFQYVRFIFTASRVAGIQIQKVYFYSNATKLDCSTATATSTPDVIDPHPASNLISNDLSKKYYYHMTSPLPVVVLIKFISPLSINRYSFISGNDVSDRDPKSWTVEVSSDNVNWRQVDTKQNYNMDLFRLKETVIFPLAYTI